MPDFAAKQPEIQEMLFYVYNLIPEPAVVLLVHFSGCRGIRVMRGVEILFGERYHPELVREPRVDAELVSVASAHRDYIEVFHEK